MIPTAEPMTANAAAHIAESSRVTVTRDDSEKILQFYYSAQNTPEARPRAPFPVRVFEHWADVWRTLNWKLTATSKELASLASDHGLIFSTPLIQGVTLLRIGRLASWVSACFVSSVRFEGVMVRNHQRASVESPVTFPLGPRRAVPDRGGQASFQKPS